jgi:hypothetical protein
MAITPGVPDQHRRAGAHHNRRTGNFQSCLALIQGEGHLDRRIGDWNRFVSGIKAWENQRNAARARIKWQFTTEKARDKLTRAYPNTAK